MDVGERKKLIAELLENAEDEIRENVRNNALYRESLLKPPQEVFTEDEWPHLRHHSVYGTRTFEFFLPNDPTRGFEWDFTNPLPSELIPIFKAAGYIGDVDAGYIVDRE